METKERKYYLDNIRWMTVILVMLYHVIYIFNSQGVLSNFGVQGIPALDTFLFLVYPWFMVLLFTVAGASAKYALANKTKKEFLKDRTKRILVPSIVIIFLFGWTAGYITNYYSDIFSGNGDLIPGFIKYFIYCMCGIGPMWFAQELYAACLVLLLILAIDKKNRLEDLCAKIRWWGYILVGISFYISAQILNTPLVEVYRNGIYIFSFLMGYYIFSKEDNLDRLAKAKIPLCATAFILNIAYAVYIWVCIYPKATDNVLTSVTYCSMSVLKNPITNLVAFTTVLAVFSAKDRLNFQNGFSRYMTKANFAYYALHYFCLSAVAFTALEIIKLPIGVCYFIDLFGMIILTTVLYEIIKRIPILRALILGICKRK